MPVSVRPSTGDLGMSRFRRETTEGFFSEESEWSRYKHEILKKYLDPWVSKLQSLGRDLAFIDTCAGRGIYDDGSEGSPVLAARMNDRSPLATSDARLIVYAIEGDDEEYAHLSRHMRPWKQRGLAHLFNQPFHEVLPRLMDQTKKHPTLVFVDPFRLVDVAPELLEPVLASTASRLPTELLFRVDAGVLARMTGHLARKPDKSVREIKLERSMRSRLLHLGLDTEILERYEDEDAGKGQRHEVLLAEFLTTFEGVFQFVTPIPVRDDYYAKPRYHLVHCTNSAHGMIRMNDNVSTTEDDLFLATETKNAAGQMFLFEPERPLRAEPGDAMPIILKMLRETPGARLEFVEITAHLASHFGPDLREKHYRSAVHQLRRDGFLEVEGSSNAVSERTWIRLKGHQPPETRPTSPRRAPVRRPSESGRRPA